MDKLDLPLGFGFSLAQHPQAMEKFSALPKETQARILQRVHELSSKQEMETFVQSLNENF